MQKENLLKGIRVVESGEGRVGPWAALLLADMGAQVIKVESITRPDMTRGTTRISIASAQGGFFPDYPDGKPGERHWNRNCEFTARNQGKLGITLDLQKAKGQAALMRIIKVSDAFISNMAVGNAEKLGIWYEDVIKYNPDIVYLSSTGYGRTGPYAKRVAMGSTVDAAAGMFALRDYGDGDATAVSPNTHCDSIGAMTNFLALLMGLHYKQKTGKGVFLDVSMVEPSMCQIGEAIMDFTMNKREDKSFGNRDQYMVQNVYRCTGGKDEWVTISIATDKEFKALAEIIGQPQLADEPRFNNVVVRRKNQDALDQIITDWTSSRNKIEIMNQLQKAGIAAGSVHNSAEVYHDPHVNARDFFEEIDQPEVGVRSLPGRIWKLTQTKLPVREHAPTLGEHNRFVLGTIAGMTEEEIADLEKDKVIGTVPII